ncbi:response regulator transcription factor [Poseidonibacter sp.]|uniref:response regulator transcription factor n=1 Tax=Poseidonibacter sp. TaxID=2321188 RepID=UPI003C7415BC
MSSSLALKILKSLNILYVEDEKNIRNNIEQILKLLCKDVYSASNGKEALSTFKKNNIDIILSDINMPEMSGLELSSEIRENHKYIPIILLTAHTDINFLLKATKLKLIDYLVKPLNLKDLKNALLNAALEYKEQFEKIIYFKNNIEYHINKKLLFENSIRKDITNKELLLLEFLYENKSRVVTKDEIKNEIWDDYFESTDSAFKSLLNKLRKKIGKESVKNISGVGYQIQTISN